MSGERFALVDEGVTYLHVDGTDLGISYPFPEQAEIKARFGRVWVPGFRAAERGWWAFEAVRYGALADVPNAVEVTVPKGRPLLGYRLRPEHVERYGAIFAQELEPETFAAMTDEDDPMHDPLASRLYEAVRGEPAFETTSIEGEWPVLEGAPPADDGLTWQAHLPAALRHRTEYLHLFPGHLLGFREYATGWLEERFEEHPELRVDAYNHAAFSVFVKALAAKDRILAVLSTDAKRTTNAIRWSVPDRIKGENRGDAKAQWDAELARLEQLIREAATPCPHCHGTGRAS